MNKIITNCKDEDKEWWEYWGLKSRPTNRQVTMFYYRVWLSRIKMKLRVAYWLCFYSIICVFKSSYEVRSIYLKMEGWNLEDTSRVTALLKVLMKKQNRKVTAKS